jgi:CRISPR/Cas system-associated exonuclease Cas4 (RecB family)
MVTKTVKPITSWSFSRLNDYRTCPLKFKLKHVDKLKEPGNDAMDRGNLIHKLAEDFVKGKTPRLAPELKLMEVELKKLKALYKKKALAMAIEDNWAFTSDWEETEWNNWIHCWVRIKLDCAHHEDETTMVVTDWKTGKYNETNNVEYSEQLELYALAALLLHPHIETVKPRLGYLDHGIWFPTPGTKQEVDLTFTQADIPRLKKLWAKRTKAMLSDTTYPPRPNDKCTWCHFGQTKKAGANGLDKKGYPGGPGICKY